MGEQQQLEPKFTPRERDVLERLARGHTNFAIAQDLGITLDGAKWHVGEILSKLGVGSREEAAAYWLRQSRLRRIGRRVRRPLATFALLKPTAVIAAASVIAASTAVFWAYSTFGRESTAPSETPVAAPFASPTRSAALAVGELLPFTCLVRTPSERANFAEMADTYARARFHGRDGVLFPGLFALQLSSVAYDSSPTANSAAIEPSSFFRSVPMPVDQCRSPLVHNIRLRDYRPIRLEVTATDPPAARLTVEPEPGVRYDVAFEPRTAPDPKGGISPRALARLTVQIEGGRFVREFSLPRYGGDAEYSPTGTLIYADVFDQTDIVWMNGGPQRLRVLSGEVGSGGVTLELRDRSGKLLSAIQLATPVHSWEQLALIDVPADAYGMVFVAGTGDFNRLLIVPAETELPPGLLNSP